MQVNDRYERAVADVLGRLAGWESAAGPAPAVRQVPASTLPAPYRSLLDHQGGMTTALETRWGGPVAVHILSREISPDGAFLNRVVVLRSELSGLPVELAGLRVYLNPLDCAFRRALLEGSEPFGRLLAQAGIVFQAEVTAFLQVPADGALAAAGGTSPGEVFYGRTARLVDREGRALGEAMELLPRA